jgi:hypothetical protein
LIDRLESVRYNELEYEDMGWLLYENQVNILKALKYFKLARDASALLKMPFDF